MKRRLYLSASLLLTSTALAQTSTTPVAGLVEQPCPPPMPIPPVLAEARKAQFDSTKTMPGAEIFSAPGVREFITATAKRSETDWANLCRYRDENSSLALDSAPQVVFIGDSITENWGYADPEFFGPRVVGRGVSGQTSQQILARFYQDVVALHPSAVHILAGTNDVAGNLGPSREQDVLNNIAAMADIARANHIHVIIGSILPAADFPWRRGLDPAGKIGSLNARLKLLARQSGALFIDYHETLAGPAGGMRDGLSTDGVHPNHAGYRVMRALAEAALKHAKPR